MLTQIRWQVHVFSILVLVFCFNYVGWWFTTQPVTINVGITSGIAALIIVARLKNIVAFGRDLWEQYQTRPTRKA